jgi:hypothetical protein
MDQRSLTEHDICTKSILPAVKRVGWDEMVRVWEEVYFTKSRTIVRCKLMASCDQLEAGLTTAATTCQLLLDALLTEALTSADNCNREMEAAE